MLAGLDVRAYPDQSRARAAAGRPPRGPAGAGPARQRRRGGVLGPGARPARRALAACVHPSFTAPEAALRSAGVAVQRVVRRAEDGFRLRPEQVDAAAGVVVVGRPDNPTGVSTDVEVLQRLVAPDRLLVLDEAFAEHGGDGLGLTADRAGLPGLVQVRSLTKVWGAAGLRLGYLVADPRRRRPAGDGAAAVARQRGRPGPDRAAPRPGSPGGGRGRAPPTRRCGGRRPGRARPPPPCARPAGPRGQAPFLLLHGPVPDLRGRPAPRTGSRSAAATPSPAWTTPSSGSPCPALREPTPSSTPWPRSWARQAGTGPPSVWCMSRGGAGGEAAHPGPRRPGRGRAGA